MYSSGHLNTLSTQIITQTAEDLSAAAADHAVWAPGTPIRVVGFGFVCVEVVGDATTAAVVSLDLRPTVGSDTNRAEKETLTIDNRAAGTVVRTAHASFAPFDVDPGQELVFEHKTAASGGTTTGTGHYFVEYYHQPEVPANFTNVVELTA